MQRAICSSENFARDGGKRSLWSFVFLVSLLIAPLHPAIAQEASPSADVPLVVRESMRATGLPSSAFAVVVQPLQGNGVHFSFNAETPMSPASTLKLVTTYAALDLLGPAYRWRTEALTTGALRGDVLDGDLVIRGSGDPRLVVENLWSLVQRVRAYGIREIHGDLVLDRSAFAPLKHDPALFDGEPLRPYNTGPDPLLLNFKALTFEFVPDAESKTARVIVTPPLAGLRWSPIISTVDGPCADWRTQLQADFSDPLEPVFHGAFPAACGPQAWHVSVLDHATYFGAVFRALWNGVSGTWSGNVRDGNATPDARSIAVHYSPPLVDVIRDINKFSNNVMARQVFLTLGAESTGQPATTEQSVLVVKEWLARRSITMPALVLENGSGLSRTERATAMGMSRLLMAAFDSALMPEFMSSLPLVNVDGLARAPSSAAGSAHIKSGSLVGVRSEAGYVRTARGKLYVLVVFVNHDLAANAQAFLDFVLDWLYANG
jgi:D-alanyl-D-alanine carboxypeptidase/D-alanyl-D-alanine-endopeptidase (penicillin-binding protein 4)